MTKTLIVFEESSKWEGVFHQELWDPDDESCLFSVSNLWKCPEDAIIGYALHDSGDAKSLIEHGIKYAQEGYENIEVKYVLCTDGEEFEEFVENYINEWKIAQKNC